MYCKKCIKYITYPNITKLPQMFHDLITFYDFSRLFYDRAVYHTSALFRLLVTRTVEITHIKYVETSLKQTSYKYTNKIT